LVQLNQELLCELINIFWVAVLDAIINGKAVFAREQNAIGDLGCVGLTQLRVGLLNLVQNGFRFREITNDQ
jgi:hypothetical protein